MSTTAKNPVGIAYWVLRKVLWQLATLPPGYPGSTMAAGRLNCCVRDGPSDQAHPVPLGTLERPIRRNRCDPSAIVTRNILGFYTLKAAQWL